VVPRHRRSEVEPSLAPLGAPVDIATNWPEPVGYGYADAAARELDWTPARGGQSWQEWQGWQDWGPPPALHPDHPSAPVPRVQFAADDQWGPEPGPRGRRAPDLPQRRPGASARRPPDGGYDNGQRRLYAVPDDAFDVDYAPPAPDGPGSQGRQFHGQMAADPEPVWRDTTGFWRQPDPAPREAAGYQRRQPGPAWQEANDYRHETGPFALAPLPATGQFQNGRPSSRDSLWEAGQVITLADGQAAQIAQDAEDYAAAICEQAEREAAAIAEHAASVRLAAEREAAAIAEQAASVRQAAQREATAITEQATGQAAAIRAAAEREAAELRARLDSMTGELGRVAAYVTENLGSSALLATALAPAAASPAFPDTISAPPGIRPAEPATTPGTRPARPDTPRPTGPGSTRPARPDASPRTRPAGPDTKPGSTKPGSTRPATTPAKKPQKRSRQQQAMRIATAGTAALLSVAVISGITEIGMRGFPFFVFRQAGTGETRPTAPTDQQFLAREAAAAHNAAAPKGRHHKTPSKTVDEHH
jgi:hypothetical protein